MPSNNPFQPTQVVEQATKQTKAFNVQHVADQSRWQEQLINATATGAIKGVEALNNSQALVQKGQDLARQGMLDGAIKEENDKRLGSIWTAPAIKKGIQAIRTENSALSFSDSIRKLQDVPAGEGGFSGLSSVEAAEKFQSLIAEQDFDDPQMQALFNQQANSMGAKFLEGHQDRYLTKLANDQTIAATDHMFNLADSLNSQYNDIRTNNPQMSPDELDVLYDQQREAYATKFKDTMKVLPTDAQRNQFIAGSITNLLTSAGTNELGQEMYEELLADPKQNLSALQHDTIRNAKARYEKQSGKSFAFEGAQSRVIYEHASKDYRTPQSTFLSNLKADSAKYGWDESTIARYMKQYSETQVRAGKANDVLNQTMTSGGAGDAYSSLDKEGKQIFQDSFNDMIHAQVADIAQKRGIAQDSVEYGTLITSAKLGALSINPSLEDQGTKNALNKSMASLRSGAIDPAQVKMLTAVYDMSKDSPHLLNNLSQDDQALLLEIGDRLQVSPESVNEIIANKARIAKAVIPPTTLTKWEGDITELAFNERQSMTDTAFGWVPFNAYTSTGREVSQQMDATRTMALDYLQLGTTDNPDVAWKMAQAKFERGSTEILGVRVPTGNKSMTSRLQIDNKYAPEVVISTAVDQIVKEFQIADGNIDIDYNMSAGVNGVITIFDGNTQEHVVTVNLENLQQYIPAGELTSRLQKAQDERDAALQRQLREREDKDVSINRRRLSSEYFSTDPEYVGPTTQSGKPMRRINSTSRGSFFNAHPK